MNTLPLFYYPSTIAWVDDDELLLEAGKSMLEPKYATQLFSSPEKCLEYFASYTPYLSQLPLSQAKVAHEDYANINHLPIDLNISSFTNLPLDHHRLREISVLIVDYRMPEMSGIELCRLLKNVPAKKILLTGEADDSTAITAFNEGIIDCFLKKGGDTFVPTLIAHVDRLTKKYFIDANKNLLAHLETEKKSHLSDPIFITYFNQWCEKYHIQEHYVFDKLGNIQAINKEGNKKYLIIHTTGTLNAFTELHQTDREVQDFVTKVAERELVPFFGVGKESWQVDYEAWGNCFYSPQVLLGRETYYLIES